MGVLSFMFVIPNLLIFFFEATYGIDSIKSTQSLADGKTLVSKDGNFELGFFSPGSSKNRYLGIWYNIQDKTVVWVANRDSPINDSSGILMINSTASLVLLAQNKSVVWSTSSLKQAQALLLQLLDTGNLVLTDEKNGNSEDYLWQSFDYPTDTSLPGMKFGWDLKRGLNMRLIAWKNWDDPSSGDLILEMTHHNYPEAYLFQGTVKYFRSGPWNGIGFSGAPAFKPNLVYAFTFVYNQDEVYFMFTRKDKVTSHNSSSKPNHLCASKFHTDGNSTKLEGFKPKSQQKWDSMDWSQGCVRNEPLNCQDKITHGERCLNNCTCMAYTNSDIKERSGCAIWLGDLLDIRQFPVGGQDLYIRMHASKFVQYQGTGNGHKKNIAAIVACSIVVVFGMLLGSYYVCSKENLRGIMERIRAIVHSSNSKGPEEDMELPLFDLSTIARATDDFSLNNKLGEGGFGPVYKAWRLWIEDRPIELIDDSVGDFTIFEVLRCIHVALLCVQQRQEDRPNMLSVVLMLSSESLLPKPRQPGFYTDSPPEADPSLSTPCSENKITFSSFDAR
uniref:Bulb-type lectin domain-containing protein n=1 Tax=Fagus sylvatica TaxID=28930 RepID=A0A2N9HWE4_FAGSY